MDDIILIGGGGHCKSVIHSIKKSGNFNIVGILDLQEKIGIKVSGVEIVGTDNDLNYYYNQGIKYGFVTMGSVDNTRIRFELGRKLREKGFKIPNIIDDQAIVSNSVHVDSGTYIAVGAIINSDVKIGANCIINTGTIIEHDCIIGDYCHIAPGSTLSGLVKVGDHTHIGTNTTIIQNINIGENTIIGAGSVVVKNIRSNAKAYGNPCKEV